MRSWKKSRRQTLYMTTLILGKSSEFVFKWLLKYKHKADKRKMVKWQEIVTTSKQTNFNETLKKRLEFNNNYRSSFQKHDVQWRMQT